MFIRSTSWLRRIGVMVVALLGVGFFVGCSSLDAQQRRWIFQPSADTWWGGSQAAAGMEDVWIDFASTETGHGARLHGLWLQNTSAASDTAAPVLLYLHGARWDVASSAMRIRRMQQLGFSVLAIDYRGFGKTSTELPSEAMAREDARSAWDWLAKQYPQAPRYIFGHSLGGAIAVDLASRVNDESGLIVEGSFTRIRDVLSTMRWGWLPVGPLLTQRFDAIDRIANVGSPVLIVHGSEDNLIPPALGHALYEHAVSPKRWVLVQGGTHHNTNDLGQAAYREAVHDLFGIGAVTAADNRGLGEDGVGGSSLSH